MKKDYFKMSGKELGEATKQFDAPTDLSKLKPLSAKQRDQWKRARKRGRPRKPEDEKVGRYMIAMSPGLHAAATSRARKTGVPLSRLIADALTERLAAKQ